MNNGPFFPLTIPDREWDDFLLNLSESGKAQAAQIDHDRIDELLQLAASFKAIHENLPAPQGQRRSLRRFDAFVAEAPRVFAEIAADVGISAEGYSCGLNMLVAIYAFKSTVDKTKAIRRPRTLEWKDFVAFFVCDFLGEKANQSPNGLFIDLLDLIYRKVDPSGRSNATECAKRALKTKRDAGARRMRGVKPVKKLPK